MMGIRNTDDTAVALYDSVTGWAFGPVFDCAFDADNFVRWTQEVKGTPDLRTLTTAELSDLHTEWIKFDWPTIDDDPDGWSEVTQQYGPFDADKS